MTQGFTGVENYITERVVTLTPGATVPVVASAGSVFDLLAGQIFTLNNPSEPTSGQKILFRIEQGGTGSYTITLDTKYRVPTDLTGFLLSTAVGTMDILGFVYHLADDKWDMTGITKGYVT